MNDYIKVDDCIDRGLYRISSRNLAFGVYRADLKGFVGIREKFGSEYLFTEYHWDTGPPFGTVRPKEFLEMCPLTDLREHLETVDRATGRTVAFDKPVSSGGKGWYFLDSGEPSQAISPLSKNNSALFAWLTEKERQFSSLTA